MYVYCKDSVAFWKDVRKLNSSSIPLLVATKVHGDGVDNKDDTRLCQEHFSTLLNSVHNTDSKKFVSEHIEHGLFRVQKTTVSASDVLDSLTLYDPGGGALKAPPPPIFCSHAFNIGAALLCVGDFSQKIV